MQIKSKNILVFASTFPKFTPGDATPPFVYELSKRLQKMGLNIVVLTPRVPGSKNFEIIDNMKIYRYTYFFFSSWEKLNDGAILPNLKANKLLYFQIPFLLFFGLLSLIRITRKEKIETIHAHWIIPQGFLAVFYKKLFNKNIKIVCTTHGGDIFGLRGRIGTYIKKLTLKNIDFLTVVSNAIKEECLLLGTKEDNIQVIPMGVDTDIFKPDNYDEELKIQYGIKGKLLLFVGRLAEKKGVKYLIEAMRGLVELHPETKLLIIGSGPLEKELKNQVETLELSENVIFLGSLSNSQLPRYFATADIFIGPSIIAKDGDREGLPVAYMEAISSGCLLLGTDLQGNKDLIVEGVNGFFIKQESSEDIKNKLLRLFDENAFDKILSRDTVVKSFSWDFVGNGYFKILNS